VRAALVALLLLAAACGGEQAPDLDREAFEHLARGELVEAEIAAEKAAVDGGPAWEARRDFLLGNAAWARSAKEELAAMGPRGASAISVAIRHAEQARASWKAAAARRDDWPEARRNVERARLRVEELMRKKAELEPESRPTPKPVPRGDRPQPSQPQLLPGMRVEPELTELPADEVTKLLDRLEEKDKDKLKVRRARQAHASLGVEKDW
jgi:hypothetical protein